MKPIAKTFLRSLVPLLAVVACSRAPAEQERTESTQQGLTAMGAVPAGLPGHVMVGLKEDHGQTWMASSGVPWDARYRYLVKGWVNNFGYGTYDGTWATSYLNEAGAKGYVPAFAYYQMQDEAGGGEDQFLAKTQNAATMKSYFSDFKILMQRVRDFGKPTMILLEADGYALLEQQTNGNPNAYAAVAASGVPELAGLPNTVAGWGLAFLQLRKSVGASNAILGIHISGWATSKDLFFGSVTDPLGPEVDKAYGFLAPLGLTANATGQTYDLLVGDPLDRDADYYQIVQGQNRWWDASDTASVNSQSFNRYAEWLRLWNVKANKRWVLWQIPEGNSNQLNVNNNGGARQGYKDNRPEYFFANGTAHVAKFADSGVIGLLFGPGMGGMSTHGNDIYTDGQSFLKSRVATFFAAGGVPLGATTPTPTPTATPTPTPTTTTAPAPPTPPAPPASLSDAGGVDAAGGDAGTVATGNSDAGTIAPGSDAGTVSNGTNGTTDPGTATPDPSRDAVDTGTPAADAGSGGGCSIVSAKAIDAPWRNASLAALAGLALVRRKRRR